jgi:hypothetical protein
MPDRDDEILSRLTRIETLLGERCENHLRRLDDHGDRLDHQGDRIAILERRRPNGNGALSGKALLALCGAIGALAGIIATLLEKLL